MGESGLGTLDCPVGGSEHSCYSSPMLRGLSEPCSCLIFCSLLCLLFCEIEKIVHFDWAKYHPGYPMVIQQQNANYPYPYPCLWELNFSERTCVSWKKIKVGNHPWFCLTHSYLPLCPHDSWSGQQRHNKRDRNIPTQCHWSPEQQANWWIALSVVSERKPATHNGIVQ